MTSTNVLVKLPKIRTNVLSILASLSAAAQDLLDNSIMTKGLKSQNERLEDAPPGVQFERNNVFLSRGSLKS